MQTLRLLSALLALACASTVSHQAREAPSANITRVAGAELVASGSGNLLEALERVRPLWIRGPRPIVSVFMNGLYFGHIEYLTLIRADDVAHVERLDGPATVILYGSQHRGPAVVITLWDGPHNL